MCHRLGVEECSGELTTRPQPGVGKKYNAYPHDTASGHSIMYLLAVTQFARGCMHSLSTTTWVNQLLLIDLKYYADVHQAVNLSRAVYTLRMHLELQHHGGILDRVTCLPLEYSSGCKHLSRMKVRQPNSEAAEH